MRRQIALWDLDFNSFGYIPRSEMIGSHEVSIFNFLRNSHPIFHSCYTILQFVSAQNVNEEKLVNIKVISSMLHTLTSWRFIITLCAFMPNRSVTSDSLWPCGPWPTRRLCLWNFPSKNTGVGCHFLLQRIHPTQGSNRHFLHCQADSSPLRHPESQSHHHLSTVSFNKMCIIILTWVLLVPPFYKCRSQGTEKLDNLLKVTQLTSGAGTRRQAVNLHLDVSHHYAILALEEEGIGEQCS